MRIFTNRDAFRPPLFRAPRWRAPGWRTFARRMPRLDALRFRAFSWAALVAALAGCEGGDRVVHSAHLDARPDMLCMKQAVEALPGIAHVNYVHADSGGAQAFDEISYEAGEQRVMLMVQPDGAYTQTFLRMSPFGSGEEAPRIRRVMARVDKALEKACHIAHLSRKVRETCMDAAHPDGRCPPLPN